MYLRWGFDSGNRWLWGNLERFSGNRWWPLNFDPFFPTVSTMVTTSIATLTPKSLAPSSGLSGSDIRSTGTSVRNTHNWKYAWHDWQHWRHLGNKKDGLAGEFRFFSQFGWWEHSVTDWKQTKAQSHCNYCKVFQTDSHRFFSVWKYSIAHNVTSETSLCHCRQILIDFSACGNIPLRTMWQAKRPLVSCFPSVSTMVTTSIATLTPKSLARSSGLGSLLSIRSCGSPVRNK